MDIEVKFKVPLACIGGLAALCLMLTVCAPYCIMSNDWNTNVWRYPFIVGFNGSGEDGKYQTGCTMTSCWTMLESLVSWRKGDISDDALGDAVESNYNINDMIHNTYTAPSCRGNEVHWPAGTEYNEDANFCAICSKMRDIAWPAGFVLISMPFIGMFIFAMGMAMIKGPLHQNKCAMLTFILLYSLTGFILNRTSMNGVADCRDSVGLYLKGINPTEETSVRFGIGGILYSVSAWAWLYMLLAPLFALALLFVGSPRDEFMEFWEFGLGDGGGRNKSSANELSLQDTTTAAAPSGEIKEYSSTFNQA